MITKLGMRRTGLLVLVLLLAGPWSGRALAEEDEATTRARQLFKKAEVHFSVGEFDRALTLYKDAYKTKPLPAFLFNIGQCHRNMGQCDRALFFFRQYLVRSPEAPNKADVEKLIQICEEEVKKGETDSGVVKRPPEKAPTVGAETTETKPADEGAPDQPRQRRKLRPLWFWSSVGLAGALLVTGTVTGVMALGKSDEYKDPTTAVEDRRNLKDTGETLRTVSTATVVTGAVAAAGAGALFFLTDWGDWGRKERTTVTAAPLDGGAAVMLGGRF